MGIDMKIRPTSLLMGLLMLHFSYEVCAMNCPLPLGLELSCPTMFNDESKAFCCNSKQDVPFCCDIGEYIANNTAIIAGVLVAALIVLIIIILCCCCFCSCCLLAKRRVNRGTVLYGPVSAAQPASSHALNPFSVGSAPPPSPSYYVPPPYPINNYQSPVNPDYVMQQGYYPAAK